MPQGRAHRYIHLIDLQGQVSTGQTQMKSRVQLTCNIFKITTRAQGQTRVFETGFNTGANPNEMVKTHESGLDQNGNNIISQTTVQIK